MSQPHRNWKEDVKVLKERCGGITEEKRARSKEQHKDLKAIRTALRSGGRTIPEIAAESGIRSDRVVWYVMAMKRYGEVKEAGRDGDYFRYALKEKQP